MNESTNNGREIDVEPLGSVPGYGDIFELRGQLYHRAMQLFPDARAQEFASVVAEARIAPHMTVVDVPSGGAYLSRYLKDAYVLGFELTTVFTDLAAAQHQNVLRYENDQLPLKDRSVDRVLSIAGLHHVEKKARLFGEMRRVLKPDGLAVLADVAEGSAVQRFLDDVVGSYSETGHSGWYFGDTTRSELAEAGLTITADKPLNFLWCAPDLEQLAEFCRILFGMVRTDTKAVAQALQEYLGVSDLEHHVGLHWQLHCFCCAPNPAAARRL